MKRNEFLKILNKMAKAIKRQDFDEPFVGPPSDLDNFNLNDIDETLDVTDLGLWDLLSGHCSELLRDDTGAPQIYMQGLKKIKLITDIRIEEVRDLFASNKMQNWVISTVCKRLIIRNTPVTSRVVKDLIERISSPDIIREKPGDISLFDLGQAIDPNPFYGSSCLMGYFTMWGNIKKSINRIYGFPVGSQPIEELKPLLKSNDISITNKAEQTVFIGILKCIKSKLDELERAI